MNWRILLISIIALLFLGGFASADGGVIPPHYNDKVLAPEQKAAIFWDGSVERMILSTKIISTNSTRMAWVIPIQSSSKPEVKQSDNSIFFELANLFSEQRIYERVPGGVGFGLGAGRTPEGVQIVQTQKIGVYDLTILKATTAESLLEWLKANDFYFPESKKSVLDYYVQKGNYYFIANKIDLLNKYPGASVGEKEKACAETIFINVDYYGLDAEEINAQIKAQIERQFNENSECSNAGFVVVTALVELREGIATPLEFTFTPEKPFYPMKISSVNDGSTLADVYLFGGQCFDDSSQQLQFKNAVQNSALAEKYGFGKNVKCVSLLRYSGPTYRLAQDSFFTEKPFSPEYDPNYVPPANFAEEFPGMLFVLILFLAIAVMPMLVVGVLTAYFAKKNRKRVQAVHAVGIAILLCAIGIPGLLLFLLAPSLETGFLIVLLAWLYSIFPTGGFLAGYYAVKKRKWWIAAVGIAALAILAVIAAALAFFASQGALF
ncbi:DUF2330 domain-containing protein [Candidatus Micrarchaeota archaeon]|nr:DUF2330 domain-containing protein [Candidatus Micrarchaeota archaeon]